MPGHNLFILPFLCSSFVDCNFWVQTSEFHSTYFVIVETESYKETVNQGQILISDFHFLLMKGPHARPPPEKEKKLRRAWVRVLDRDGCIQLPILQDWDLVRHADANARSSACHTVPLLYHTQGLHQHKRCSRCKADLPPHPTYYPGCVGVVSRSGDDGCTGPCGQWTATSRAPIDGRLVMHSCSEGWWCTSQLLEATHSTGSPLVAGGAVEPPATSILIFF